MATQSQKDTIAHPSKDLRCQFERKLQLLLEEYPHLNHSDRRCTDKILRAAGGSGDVYEAHLWIGENRVKVALKQMRTYMLKDDNFAKLYAREMIVWSGLRHDNVVELIGYLYDENKNPMLVSKWMENGTALEFVKNCPTADVFRLVQGIARGLDYLHYSNVVHSDIKSDNVLISDTGVPQICDFGMSRLIVASQQQTTTDSLRGSIRWLSSEFLNEGKLQNKHTKETDIWAFGMTTYELLTQRRPYHNKSHVFDIIRTIADGGKPEFPSTDESSSPSLSSKVLRDVCHVCWLTDPKERWPMSRIVQFLSDELSSQDQGVAPCYTPSMSDSETAVEPSIITDTQLGVEILAEDRTANRDLGDSERRDPLSDSAALATLYDQVILQNKQIGNWRQALEACQSAIRIRRQMASVNPRYLHDLGDSLHELGICQEKNGQCVGAVRAAQETVAIREFLADENPDLRPELGTSYHLLGVYLERLEHYEDAVKSTQAAIHIWAQLTDGLPQYLANLASSYHSLGIQFMRSERPLEAVKATQAAISIRSRLANDDVRMLHNLGISYYHLGSQLQACGHIEDAVKSTQAAVRIGSELVDEDIKFLPHLASAYHLLGTQLDVCGRHRDADTAFRATAQVRERMARIPQRRQTRN